MVIRRLHIHNFGGLTDFKIEPHRCFNMIYAPNESGKSTLLAFIKFIFYGTKIRKASKELSFKEKYMPWNGMNMSGSMEFEHDGVRYSIFRSEGARSGSKIFEMHNALTGEKVTDIAEPGKYFFSVGERAFSDSCFVKNISAITDSDDDISALVSGNGSEAATYMRAKSYLEEKILKLSSGKRSNSRISILEKEYSRYAERYREVRCKHEKYLKGLSDLQAEEERLANLTSDLHDLKMKIRKLSAESEKEKYDSLLRQLDEQQRIFDEINSEYEALVLNEQTERKLTHEDQITMAMNTSNLEMSRDEKSRNLYAHKLMLIFSCFLFFSGFLALIYPVMYVLGAVGIVGILFSGYRLSILNKLIKEIENNIKCVNNKKQALFQKLGVSSANEYYKIAARQDASDELKAAATMKIKLQSEKISTIQNELKMSRNKLFPADFEQTEFFVEINSFTKEEINDIIIKTEREIDACKEKIHSLSYINHELKLIENEIDELNARMAEIDSKRRLLFEEIEVYETALSVLEQAYNKLRTSFSHSFSKRVQEVLSEVCGDRYSVIFSGETLVPVIKRGDSYKDMRFLSDGTYDLICLAMRIAASDCLSESEGVPVFFDDSFSSLDDARGDAMLRFLYKLSEEKQIFVCTCRENEKNIMSNFQNKKIFIMERMR